MIGDIFVVAGNKKQFDSLLGYAEEFWAFEIKNKMVHYVHHPDVLKGRHQARVFFYGTYLRRPDIAAIKEELIAGNHRPLVIR
jgi:hypothetical protein